MDVHWDEGSAACAKRSFSPLQVHPYNASTFILRENLCATFEAPFMYLLIGSTRALLIDTGDIADPDQMPLAKTVLGLLPGKASEKLPLLVVHTHRHRDHRAGDGQFADLANAQVVGFDLGSIRRYYGFNEWPNGVAHIDVGDRVVDVIPTPGHDRTEVSFYDRNTGLLFTGDVLMPARLLIEDTAAALASAQRLVAFLSNHPTTLVLGGHIEMDSSGRMFPDRSEFHPHEHVLQMTSADVLALPGAVRAFNGFYTRAGRFVLINPVHNVIAVAAAVLLLLLAPVAVLCRR